MQKYPALRLIIRHGNVASVVCAGAVLVLSIGSARNRLGLGTWIRSLGLAGAVGIGIKNLTELNQIISDALLPQ